MKLSEDDLNDLDKDSEINRRTDDNNGGDDQGLWCHSE